MKYFLDMIDAARSHGITVQRVDGSAPIERRALTPTEWSYFERCQPFVFTPTELKDISIAGELINDKLGEIEDAPFPVFSVEIEDETIALGSLMSPKNNEILVNCIMAVETAPNQFLLYIFVVDNQNPFTRPTVILATHSLIMPLLTKYLERMKKEQMGLETCRTNVKLGTGSGKKMHRIRRIIHVAPKKSQTSTFGVSGRDVDWTHRFEVRGHWRKLELQANGEQPIGKDREGNYDVKGFTWVSHHTRGPEHLPLIKKTRMVEL